MSENEWVRLDRALVARGMVRSRTEAQALIAAGQVHADGQPATKASQPVTPETTLEILGPRLAYVSRGGLKLEAALTAFGLAVIGRLALDVGASTGGFTDCLLQHGARHVVALDVGHGQMDKSLLDDPRITLREGVNARSLTPTDFDAPFEIIVVDLSFISLTLVLPALASLLAPAGDMVCLVKPQFEVGAGALGKGGIVRDSGRRESAVARVLETAEAHGLQTRGRIDSPIVGGDGNSEYLVWLGFERKSGRRVKERPWD